jgi:hypothetical protein
LNGSTHNYSHRDEIEFLSERNHVFSFLSFFFFLFLSFALERPHCSLSLFRETLPWIHTGKSLLFFFGENCYQNYAGGHVDAPANRELVMPMRGTPELVTVADPLPRLSTHLGAVAMAKGGWFTAQ